MLHMARGTDSCASGCVTSDQLSRPARKQSRRQRSLKWSLPTQACELPVRSRWLTLVSVARMTSSAASAQFATMRRSGQWLHDSSYEDGPQGPATSSHSFRRHEHWRVAVPASVDFACTATAELIARLLVNVKQSEDLPMLAFLRAGRNRRSRIDDCHRERHRRWRSPP